ncbi:unnamed protein product [Bursaphelenchus xylophilus]|nr:unnamed protein product [Bursaphelenchus xylophilus]CAG9116870.1 unnamed protein product [Bursaphelenchus xylophilus]
MNETYGSNGSTGQSDPMDVPREMREDFPVARSVDHLLVHNVRHDGMSRVQSASAIRRPFVYSNRSRASSVNSEATSQNAESHHHRHHNMAIRYRLFNRLDPGGQTLRMPDHVYFPSEWFSILPFDDFKDNEGKQSSLVTIFSIWNTMMGTSLLAMPWALAQAGLGLGVTLMALMAFLSLYTAYRVVESPRGLTLDVECSAAEFSDVCRYYWGKKGEYTAVFFSIIVLFGGVIVYFVLMSNFLYFTGNIVYESLQPNSTVLPVLANKTFTCDIYYDEKCLPPKDMFDYEEDNGGSSWWSFSKLWSLQGTVPIYLGILTFPLLNFQSPTIFTKFNVLGTISVFYLISFTMSKAYECGMNVNFVDPTSIHYVELWNSKFTALTGTLALSYFIHNAVLTILRNQKNPENNARDLSIGYILAMMCYILIGCLFYLAFPGRRECISDNFLNNFGSGDVLSATARMFLLFQMITVLPLLMYLVRVQFSYVFTGTVYPGLPYVCLINVLVILVAIFFCIAYPHVGGILRYVGSLSGLVYIFALPSLVHLKRLQTAGRLTKTQIVLHGIIIILGVANLISQFLV